MMRRSDQNRQSSDVEAEIKIEIFTEIFEAMTKNMKENERLYFIFNERQMKIWLCQTSKTTQMELKLSSKIFKNYSCIYSTRRSCFRKYQLKKFCWFSSFFESYKQNLKILVTPSMIQFSNSSNNEQRQNKVCKFPVRGQIITQDEEDDLQNTNLNIENNEKNFCKLTFGKSKMIKQVIHSGNAMKVAKLWLTYLPNEKKLQFDFKYSQGPRLKVKVDEVQTKGSALLKIAFPFRKLKLATTLLENDQPFKLVLTPIALTILYDEQNKKKYNITILAENDND